MLTDFSTCDLGTKSRVFRVSRGCWLQAGGALLVGGDHSPLLLGPAANPLSGLPSATAPLSPEPQTTAPAAGLCKPRGGAEGEAGSTQSVLPPSLLPPSLPSPGPSTRFTTQHPRLLAPHLPLTQGPFENWMNATFLPHHQLHRSTALCLSSHRTPGSLSLSMDSPLEFTDHRLGTPALVLFRTRNPLRTTYLHCSPPMTLPSLPQ